MSGRTTAKPAQLLLAIEAYGLVVQNRLRASSWLQAARTGRRRWARPWHACGRCQPDLAPAASWRGRSRDVGQAVVWNAPAPAELTRTPRRQARHQASSGASTRLKLRRDGDGTPLGVVDHRPAAAHMHGVVSMVGPAGQPLGQRAAHGLLVQAGRADAAGAPCATARPIITAPVGVELELGLGGQQACTS